MGRQVGQKWGIVRCDIDDGRERGAQVVETRSVQGKSIVKLPLDRAGWVEAEIRGVGGSRLERDVLEHLLVVGERIDAGQRQRFDHRIVVQRDLRK